MNLSSKTKCAHCGGSGYELVQIDELKKIDANKYHDTIQKHEKLYGEGYCNSGYAIPCRYCNSLFTERTNDARKRARLPKSFSDKVMKHFRTDAYVTPTGQTIDISKKMQVVNSFVKDFPKWQAQGLGLYIYSKTRGSGKTFLASCICNELMCRYGTQTKFVSCAEIIELVKDTKEGYNPLTTLKKCQVLVLDDLGVKRNSWLDDLLFQIIDARYQNGLVTLFTSNLPINALDLDDRLSDRINATALQIALPECSARSQKANSQKAEFLKALGI